MKLSRQFFVCSLPFFLRKNFVTQKTQNNQKPTNKQKQANKKQQMQQFFVHKNFLRGRNSLFCVFFSFKISLKTI